MILCLLSIQWSQIFSKDDEELPNSERRLQEGYWEVQEEAQRLDSWEALRTYHGPPRVSKLTFSSFFFSEFLYDVLSLVWLKL